MVQANVSITSLVLLATLAVLPAGSTIATELVVQPSSVIHADRLIPDDEVPSVTVPPVDTLMAEIEDEQRRAAGLPERFAIANEVKVNPASHGIWEEVDGSAIWRLRIGSPGAVSLNLGFTRYSMPEGGRLLIHSPESGKLIRPFTRRDNAEHGQLWTPPLRGAEIVLELTLPGTEVENLELELTRVNVGYREFGAGSAVLRSGSCNNDVVCPEAVPWLDEVKSVAVFAIGGTGICTGFMIGNTSQDLTPYFMTAFHCGLDASNAAALVVFWNYETSTCGGTPDGTLDDFQTGAFFRAGYSLSDFTLVELDEHPDPAWNVGFAGWDRRDATSTSAAAIHHPNLDEKRISFDNNSTTVTSYFGVASPGDGTHLRIGNWEDGTTEGGSSGSPLFNQDHRVIGQLHGGNASCASNTDDWYGRFFRSWSGGGSSSTRLSDWLDPGSTGTLTLDTRVPSPPRLQYASHVIDDGAGNNDGFADPGETVVLPIDLSNTGVSTATGVSGTLSTTAPFVTVIDAGATWPNIPDSMGATSDAPHFSVQLDPSLPCGNAVQFTLNHVANEPPDRVSQFSMNVGSNSGPLPGFSDDMESGTGAWTTQSSGTSNDWVQTEAQAGSPTHSWLANDVASVSDTVLVSPPIDNPLELRFELFLESEGGFDGGVLEYSTDGGSSWLDAGSTFPNNVAYNVVISTEWGSPLAGRSAWSGTTGGAWLNVIFDLSSITGTTSIFRWRFATDSSVGADGMYIDDVEFDVTTPTCAPAIVPPGEVSAPGSTPFTINPDPGGHVLAWDPPTTGGTVAEYLLYSVPMATPTTPAVCEGSLGGGTSAVVAALPDDTNFLIGSRNAAGDGPFGNGRAPAGAPCP